MLRAGGVAKEGHQGKGADVDVKLQETAEALGTTAEDDEAVDLPPAAGLADIARFLPGEPAFVPREDGPAAVWLACVVE